MFEVLFVKQSLLVRNTAAELLIDIVPAGAFTREGGYSVPSTGRRLFTGSQATQAGLDALDAVMFLGGSSRFLEQNRVDVVFHPLARLLLLVLLGCLPTDGAGNHALERCLASTAASVFFACGIFIDQISTQ